MENAVTAGRPNVSPVIAMYPMRTFAAPEPAAEIRIVARPPHRSVSGPLSRNDSP
jgi:hypothetical protein